MTIGGSWSVKNIGGKDLKIVAKAIRGFLELLIAFPKKIRFSQKS
jgi:hypothetical protein